MSDQTSTALATYQPPAQRAETALEPHDAREAMWVAQQLASSGMTGKVRTPEAVFAVLVTGRELGLTSMQSLRSIHIIDGKPTLSADLMVALCKRSSLCKSFRLVESSATIATYETERVGEGSTRMSYTFEEAKAAGLTSRDNWKKYTAAMLRARCSSALARAVYPDLLVGIYESDEVQEVAPAATTTTAATERVTAERPRIVDAEVVEPLTPPPAKRPATTITEAVEQHTYGLGPSGLGPAIPNYRCLVCKEAVFESPSGPVCKLGHGGATEPIEFTDADVAPAPTDKPPKPSMSQDELDAMDFDCFVSEMNEVAMSSGSVDERKKQLLDVAQRAKVRFPDKGHRYRVALATVYTQSLGRITASGEKAS
jgi:hypothetical protein